MSLIDELDYYASVDRAIFDEEFADWLPRRIFDVHTHAWLPEHCLRPFAEERVGLVFEAESVSVPELEEAYSLLFPGRQVDYLAFGMPLTIIDREANNAYVGGNIDGQHRYGLLVPGLQDDAETLWAQIQAGGFSGFKPYLSYVTWKGIEEIRVRDFVTDAALEVAHAHGLIIMLHVPRNTRLPDPDNLADLEYIAAHYPNARVILAHGGRAYSRSLIERALGRVAVLPNMYFDFSVVQSAEVVEAICAHMPAGRVMYGSDIPVATVRGLLFMLNGQRVTLTRKPFPWSLSNPASPLKCTFMGYEQLRAMKRACDNLGWGPEQVNDLFYGTARALVDAATAAVRGG
ncbi:MAG: amidohydrolase [Pleurocapsa minor GSE-CHR-MK-17-07R]|jgi:glutamate-1-semialdehyde 2,1-aminomutase|nr:amidohydrolase [Pleurocapsa minor GSE-CHR-MK 17-07R]